MAGLSRVLRFRCMTTAAPAPSRRPSVAVGPFAPMPLEVVQQSFPIEHDHVRLSAWAGFPPIFESTIQRAVAQDLATQARPPMSFAQANFAGLEIEPPLARLRRRRLRIEFRRSLALRAFDRESPPRIMPSCSDEVCPERSRARPSHASSIPWPRGCDPLYARKFEGAAAMAAKTKMARRPWRGCCRSLVSATSRDERHGASISRVLLRAPRRVLAHLPVCTRGSAPRDSQWHRGALLAFLPPP